MLVANWMTTDVYSITPDRSMMKASKIMKDKDIGRLPVVDENNKLIGIVSDRDVRDASPSKATTLDMHELYYLLSEVKVSDIMTKNPVSIRADETVEKAAVLMLENNFGGLPVVDDENTVVGIISDHDVFKVLVEISGIYEGGAQVCLHLSTDPGSLAPALEFLKEQGARIMSIMSRNVPEAQGTKDVFIRIRDMDKPEFARLQDALAERFEVKFWVTDYVNTTA